MDHISPVILCGGNGARLWPRSRASKPKPFLQLVGPDTPFEQTLMRFSKKKCFAPPVIVTGARHMEHACGPAANKLSAQVIVEPCPKNTAAAIALAACRLPRDAMMLVCPSDHHIADVPAFVETATRAAEIAREGWLVCFSIVARSAETRFGYLRRGGPIGHGAYRVEEFIEKPDAVRARAFTHSPEYSWNAGIFACTAGTFLLELEKRRPVLARTVQNAVDKGAEDEEGRFHPDVMQYASVKAESVDYAVMESTDRAAMIEADIGWSDLGDWGALHSVRSRDQLGNSVRGPVKLVNCRNVLVETDGPRVSLLGIDDLIVVVDGEDVMITTAKSSHMVVNFFAADEH